MKTQNLIQYLKEIFPGLIVCIIIGLISKFLGTLIPAIGVLQFLFYLVYY